MMVQKYVGSEIGSLSKEELELFIKQLAFKFSKPNVKILVKKDGVVLSAEGPEYYQKVKGGFY